MRIEEKPNWLLNYKEINKLPVKINVPLLIDENDNVLLGNSLKDYYRNEININCVIIKNSLAFRLEKWLYDLETYLIEENNIERYHNIESEIQNLLKLATSSDLNDNLFILSKETRTILDVEFDKPGKFKFKSSRKKEDEDDNLFSSFGE